MRIEINGQLFKVSCSRQLLHGSIWIFNITFPSDTSNTLKRYVIYTRTLRLKESDELFEKGGGRLKGFGTEQVLI